MLCFLQLENVDYPEYGVINLPNRHQADQSNGVDVQEYGPGNHSQRLIQHDNADDNHQSNTLFTNGGGQAVDGGEVLGDDQHNSDGSTDRNVNGEHGDKHERNLNLNSLVNGDAEIGINNNDDLENNEQSLHVDEQHVESVDSEHQEHFLQPGIEHEEQSTESTRNGEKHLVNDVRPHVHVSVMRSNNMSTTQEAKFDILTTASLHLHERRELPGVEVGRRHYERQPLLLDASLTGDHTTQGRVSQLNYSSDRGSMEQHQPFLLEPQEGAGNQGSQISPSVQSNPGSMHSHVEQQEQKENENLGSSPDAGHNEPQHEQHCENDENNHQNTIPLIHTVTLSQDGIIPHEKEENANSEPEIVLSNHTYSSTTPVDSAHKQNVNEGTFSENFRPSVGQSGIDIPIGNRNNTHSTTPERIDQGQSRHTLNPLTPQITTALQVIERQLTSDRMTISPTAAIEREREVEHSTTTNTFRSSLSGEFNHEISGAGSDLGGEGSGSENLNTDIDCNQNSNVDESESHETDNSEAESSGQENIIDMGNKQNKDGIKHTNCRVRSSTLVLESITQSFEQMGSFEPSPRNLLQPSVTTPELLFTSGLLPSIFGLSPESTQKSTHREIGSSYHENIESDFSLPILSNTYDYETDYSPEIFPSETTADLFSSNYHQTSSSFGKSAWPDRPFATGTVSDLSIYSPRNTLAESREQQSSDKITILPTAASTYMFQSLGSIIVSDSVSEKPFLSLTRSDASMFDFKVNISATSSLFVSGAKKTSIHLGSSIRSSLVKTSGSTEVVTISSRGTETISPKSRVINESTQTSISTTPSSLRFSSATTTSTSKGIFTEPFLNVYVCA